jgi:hypothetical protein
MSPADRTQLEAQAEHARERLLGALRQLDTRAKTWTRSALDVTRVSGWGVAGAFALWAGVVLLTRGRERPRSALVRISRPSLARRITLHVLRGSAAIAGFLASRAWAQRYIEAHRRSHDGSSGSPHMRQLGGAVGPLLAADLSRTLNARGTSDA